MGALYTLQTTHNIFFMEPSQPVAPAPVAPAMSSGLKTSGFAVTSLVLGIISLFPLPFTAIPCGALALIFGIIAFKKIKQGLFAGKGLSIAGITTGSIGLVIGLINVILFVLFVSSVASGIKDARINVNSSGVPLQSESVQEGVQTR
jgi:hypothetical protein